MNNNNDISFETSDNRAYLSALVNPLVVGEISKGDIYYFREAKLNNDDDYLITPYFLEVEKVLSYCNEIHFFEIKPSLNSTTQSISLFESMHLNYIPLAGEDNRGLKFKCKLNEFQNNFIIYDKTKEVSSYFTCSLDETIKDIKKIDFIKIRILNDHSF